jgi:triosephosphate isomerase
MRRNIVAGNWKMNGTIDETRKLLGDLLDGDSKSDNATVIVCPPFTALAEAARMLSGTHIGLGAQNISEHEKGAFTGEISARMLLTVGVNWVILGHSERRQYQREDDALINLKVKRAIAAGLTPIVCVGETLTQREAGQTEAVVAEQVAGTLAGFSADELKRVVIAYEPVWAIGTGRTATPEMAQEVHRFIRQKLAETDPEIAEIMSILYGGSVKPGNAAGLFEQPDIDGGLIGGASLSAADFIGIINAV